MMLLECSKRPLGKPGARRIPVRRGACALHKVLIPLFIAAVLAVVLLGTRPTVLVELAVLTAWVLVLSRILKRASPRTEAVRLIAGIPLYLLALGIQVILVVLLSHARALTPLALIVVTSLPPGAALAVSVLAAYRFRRPDEEPRKVRIMLFVMLGVVLAATEIPPPLPTAGAICAAIWAFPKGCLKDLARSHRRRAILLGIAAPFAFIFMTNSTLDEGPASSADVSLGGSSVFTLVRVFVAAYWLTVLLRLALLSVRGFSLTLPIRARLGLTYLFSTALPALLTVVFLAVAMYAGIGALRARSARNLVLADLDDLEVRLREGPRSRACRADSLAEAVYLRVPVDTRGTETSTPDSVSIAQTRNQLAVALPLLSESRLGPLEPGPAAGRAAGCLPPERSEIWVRVASHSVWTPPDTLPPLPGWTDSATTGSGIVPVRGPRTYYVAAEPSDVSACLVRTLLQPLSASILERYRKLLGCDVVIDPAPRWSVRTEVGRGMVVGADRSWSFWPEAPAVTTVHDSGRSSLVHRSLYHGVSDLHLAGGGDAPDRVVALIMVRTSLAELISSLYSTGGMNTAVVLLLLIVAALILVAVLFSSYLGFSLSRSITGSVAALRRGAERLGEGDLDARIELSTKDELAKLAGSFNRMASDLKQMIREVARRERLEREVQIAREIQVNMLPQELPSPEGYELAGASHPATEVAGDYYDSVLLEGGKLAVVVADVSGKGLAAAMLMSNLQASLHVLLHQQRSLDETIERLNELIHRNSNPDMFITLFVGVIDLRTGSMEYVNAGHDPPILVKQDGSVDLPSTGLVLGVMPEAKYQVASALLEPGDCLIMYSDGVTEAMDAAEEQFGRDRLVEVLRGLGECDAHSVVAAVTQRVHDHVGVGAAPGDDLTLLVVKTASTSS